MAGYKKGLKFPYYINGHEACKYSLMSNAIPKAVAHLLHRPRSKFVEIIRRSDNALMVVVRRSAAGNINIERIRYGNNQAPMAEKKSNVVHMDKLLKQRQSA